MDQNLIVSANPKVPSPQKILVTEAMPLFEEEKRILEKQAIVKLALNSSEANIIAEIDDAYVLMVVYAKITKNILDSAKHLKGIIRYGIGTDNIDIDVATKKGIFVANVPDYCINAVADHTLALTLALARKVVLADRIVKTGNWGTWSSPKMQLRGSDLEGKIFGLIGLGKIGSAVAKRAKSFGMKIIVYDPYLKKEKAESLEMKLVDLKILLRESDFISIHSPLTQETRGLIGEDELSEMKKTAYLINTARGPIIKERALVNALGRGLIAGAAIDVYAKEPPDPQSELLKLENVILTPHIAYYTEEALRRLEMSAVYEAIRILNGQVPRNLVNQKVLKLRKR